MFDDFLVGKGLAEHGILEKSEKEPDHDEVTFAD
jgi:hypothetical protein